MVKLRLLWEDFKGKTSRCIVLYTYKILISAKNYNGISGSSVVVFYAKKYIFFDYDFKPIIKDG